MTETLLSSIIEFTDKIYSEKVFKVNCSHTFNGVSFFDCKFNCGNDTQLHFVECEIKRCKFIGDYTFGLYQKRSGSLIFQDLSDFALNEFREQFTNIKLLRLTIFSLFDKSTVLNYTAKETHFISSLVMGTCDKLTLENVYFSAMLNNKNSMWDKVVSQKAICNSAVFNNIKVNPYYFVTKCADKSSLDLSKAKIIDNWAELRKNYSGLNLVIIFILTLLYFLPIITHSFFLIVASNINTEALLIKKIPLWQALMYGGRSGGMALIYFFLTFSLLFYNLGRLWITTSIAKLRQEELFLRDSGFGLVAIDPEKYRNQLRLHRILKWLFWLSFIYALLKLIDTLRILVPEFR